MRLRSSEKVIDMTRGPILGPLISFSLPIMFTGILQLFFNAADIIVIGQFVGADAVAAVGSTTSLIFLMINLFIGISTGTTVKIANVLGSGRRDVGRLVHTSYAFGIPGGFAIGALSFALTRVMLVWMGTPPEVLEQAVLYMRIYFIGAPAFMAYTFGRAIIVSAGDTKHPLYYLTASGIVNVILNVILVTVFNFGVAGVAIATVIAQILSAILMTWKLVTIGGPCHLNIRRLSIDWRSLASILAIGVPAGLQGILFQISNVLIQSAVNSLGALVVAGNSAAASIEGFVYISYNAFSQGCMTFTGQNYGACHWDRIKKIYKSSLLCVLALTLTMGTLISIFAAPLLRIYLPDSPGAVSFGRIRLITICMPYFIAGMMDNANYVLRGMGKSVFPTAATVAGVCVFRVIWIYTIFAWFFDNSSSTSAYIWLLVSYPVSWLLTYAVQEIYYRRQMRIFSK